MSIIKLGECCDFFNGGAWSQGEFSESGHPVLKVSNCKPSGFVIDNISYIPDEIAERSEVNRLHIGDVIIATVGSHPNLIDSAAGRSCIVNNQVDGYYLNQNAVCLRSKNEDLLDQRYLGYLVSSSSFRHYIQSRGKGAANQMRIAISAIKEYTFDIPHIEVQRKIGAFLSDYDDLIENNQMQIKLLEEAAQRLYKEWFIDLRFPGYEHTKVVDGVPEGWRKRNLCELASVVMGQSPKSEYYNHDGEGLPFHQGVGTYGTRFVIDETYSTSYTRIAEEKSVLFSVRAPVGRLNINRQKCVIGRGLAAINHREGLQSYLFYMLKERFFKDDIIGNGSIFASISKDELSSQEFIEPTEELRFKYNSAVVVMDRKIELIDKQIQHLTEIKNRLLQKLMSGEIEV